MKKIEQIELMFYENGILEYDEKEEKIYLKISRHNYNEIMKKIKQILEED